MFLLTVDKDNKHDIVLNSKSSENIGGILKNFKKWCVRAGGALALLVCIPILWRIHEGDILNPMSYFLWSFLSLICAVSLIRAKEGGATMVLGYIFSDFSIGLYAYKKSGKAEFGRFEWIIAALTILCVFMYMVCEKRKRYTPSVILNTTACIIAGVPLMIESFQSPYSISYLVCFLYLCVSGLTFFGEQPNLKAKLLPGASIVYWIIIVIGLVFLRSSGA